MARNAYAMGDHVGKSVMRVTSRSTPSLREFAILLAITAGAFAFDVLSKLLVHETLGIGGGFWIVRPDLYIQHVQHAAPVGVAEYLRVLAAPAAAAWATLLVPRRGRPRVWFSMRVAICLYFAGLAANSAERILHGSVTDFLGVRGHGISNLADLFQYAGFAGAVLAVVWMVIPWVYAHRERGAQ
jgi:lipoprotein signal peptidase